ncbi:hypothetical protein DC365_24480 [Vibrio vulnificus]|uniref:hypothetical protein n=1 Tax=Vibrio vulnificus TaxID=672 RepID=UPI000D3E1898|nr:hypothetical protein [Vibrio vulnificus]MBN8110253.1 hypothetical protein [Vibrio vulnificus]PUZ79538.1 hypothetical protein DC360_23130 [Vibrio vulnificus]PUZ91875.1 hypothetical protein DC365_24480 [Vibrio vulnificus]HAS6032026.1 hypothetical protein [Vibrio vulnificus]HAS6050799.1 hypothetical protein [Vibrio vulnificus]
MKRDFEFVVSILDGFFAQRDIQDRFALIESKPITGWEIWLQVELGMFLDAHPEIAKWEREFQYSIDKRKARNREYMAIDFVFRKKRSALDQKIALEIKQNAKFRSCIRGMMEDTCKVSMVKGTHDNLRSMWTLGIFPEPEGESIEETIRDYADRFNVALLKSCIKTKPILGTKFMYTLF